MHTHKFLFLFPASSKYVCLVEGGKRISDKVSSFLSRENSNEWMYISSFKLHLIKIAPRENQTCPMCNIKRENLYALGMKVYKSQVSGASKRKRKEKREWNLCEEEKHESRVCVGALFCFLCLLFVDVVVIPIDIFFSSSNFHMLMTWWILKKPPYPQI